MRTDNFCARSDDAANEAVAASPMCRTMVEMENSKTPLPWTDPAKTHHMGKESDSVFFFSKNLMAKVGV